MKRLIALIGAGVLAAAPAQAQELTPKQREEMYCVHDLLKATGKLQDVVASYITESLPESAYRAAGAAVESVERQCQAKYGWTPEQTGHGINVSVSRGATEHLEDVLEEAGVTAAMREKAYAAGTGLAPDEQQKLLTGRWETDAALKAKLRKALAAAGVPDEDTTMQQAMLMMETGGVWGGSIQMFVKYRFK
jgi:hypothetical protein